MMRLEKQIFQYNKARQLSAALLSLIASLLFISFGLFVKYSVDNRELFLSYHGVAIFCGCFLALRLLMPMAYALIELVVHGYCIDAEAKIRNEAFKEINLIRADELEMRSRGEMISAYEAAMGSIGTYIRTLWSDSSPVVFQTLFIIISMFYYLGPVIAVEFVLVLALYVFFIIKMTNARRPLMKGVAISQKKMSASLHEFFATVLPVKIYSANLRSVERYSVVTKAYSVSQQNIRSKFYRFGAVAAVLSTLGSALILLTAASSFSNGAITFGSLLMLATFLFQVFLPLNRMGVLWRSLSRSRIDFQIFNEKLSQYKKHDSLTKIILDDSETLSIQLDNLHKRKGKNSVFSGLTGLIKNTKGQPTFILGNNGVGKSTLIRMISGLDQPDDGRIFINGTLVGNNCYGTAIPGIALTPQTLTLLNDTIENNIKFFLGCFDRNEFEKLAKMLDLHLQLSHVVNNFGGSLSGGELQKLNIIIAFLRRPECLIMDEPTSSLDSSSTQALIKLIQTYSESLQIIIISHDLVFIRAFPLSSKYEISNLAIKTILNACDQTVSAT